MSPWFLAAAGERWPAHGGSDPIDRAAEGPSAPSGAGRNSAASPASSYAAAVDVGETVQDFQLPDETGTERKLSELLEAGPVVLFFYPAAMTYGCTKESCHFRDLQQEFSAVGAQPVGISVDPVEKQKQFSETHGFGFPLLSDADGSVAETMGVRRRWGPIPVRRTTFVIDKDGSLLARYHNELQMGAHADQALKLLRERAAR